jgi:hypothetical protein
MTTLARDTHGRAIKISRFDDYIHAFDSVLDRIQKVMPDDLKVYERIVEARDAVFRLQQQMHGCEIVEFACSELDDVVYENALADLFWDREKQNAYDEETDEGMEDDLN